MPANSIVHVAKYARNMHRGAALISIAAKKNPGVFSISCRVKGIWPTPPIIEKSHLLIIAIIHLVSSTSYIVTVANSVFSFSFFFSPPIIGTRRQISQSIVPLRATPFVTLMRISRNWTKSRLELRTAHEIASARLQPQVI